MHVQKNVFASPVVIFVGMLFRIIFFSEDKDGNIQIVNGGPNGCSLHKDKKHQRIAKNCGYCQDFHCVNATEDNKDSWVVKEFADD